MKKNLTLVVLLFTALFLGSCKNDDDCTASTPPYMGIELGYFDDAGTSLIATSYNQDQFRIFNETSEVFITPGSINGIQRLSLQLINFESDTDYYIELTDNDTDTIQLQYELIQQSCFNTYDLREVFYNGEPVQIEDDIIVDIIK
ncbi:hypothetical protein [Aquimarina brevivitae]|uniref:Uncharacterized protein n=1 Tax=Aquimarina brevivitae TaxID=323412 RepID=A0A4Q7PJD4_9FLAO|nr:hypothetical protein [Aquimarina brevivitae]RZT00159.1 hypothetical protein EV197_1392 [Aquimarina brevivitae]